MKNMNTYIIGIIILFILGGGYFFSTSQDRKETTGRPVTQSHRSYEVEVVSDITLVVPGKPTKIVYKIKNDKGEIFKKFEVVHEKIMHFIVVRDDLKNFQHLHPDMNESTGEFSIDVTFPTEGPYRLFPDFTPRDDNPQKLPVTVFVDMDVGDMTKYKAQSVIPDTQATKTYGDYQVTFAVPEVKAQEEFTYSLEVNKNGQPVTDFQKYLGALGHSVILKKETLDFIHTHAGETGTSQGIQHDGTIVGNTENNGPKIEFSTTFPESGVYKIFTQFQHQGNVLTVDYVINVE